MFSILGIYRSAAATAVPHRLFRLCCHGSSRSSSSTSFFSRGKSSTGIYPSARSVPPISIFYAIDRDQPDHLEGFIGGILEYQPLTSHLCHMLQVRNSPLSKIDSCVILPTPPITLPPKIRLTKGDRAKLKAVPLPFFRGVRRHLESKHAPHVSQKSLSWRALR